MEGGGALVDCLRRDHKRTHDQMSREDNRRSSSWTSIPSESPFALPNSPAHFILPPMRFSGDGYDMRTPVMSEPTTFIDLTEEPDTPRQPRGGVHANSTTTSYRANRPPRFSRDIIDLDPDNGSGSNDEVAEDASPDVEILSSAPSTASRSQQQPPRGFADIDFGAWRPITSAQGNRGARNSNTPFSLHYIRNIVRQTTASHINRHNIDVVIDEEELQRSNTQRHGSMRYPPLHFDIEDPSDEGDLFPRNFLRTRLPEGLQYDTQGFPMGDIPLAAPTYNAPPPPRDGFTRSPIEEQQVVCPNCDKELGMGDDEVQKSVWVVKGCGHVYCGNCTKYRHKKPKQSRPSQSKPFSKCVVEGCGKTLISSSKSMFQIYL